MPVEIRKDCASAREEDLEPLEEEFQYWTISHMTSILESRWAIFSKILPGRMVADKKGFLSTLKKMNRIRNRIMHPIRGYVPTQYDFEHLEDIWKMLLFDYPSSKLGGPLPDRIDLDLTLSDDAGG